MGVVRVERKGSMRTNRVRIPCELGGMIELDTVYLPNGSEVHEVEYEADDLAQLLVFDQWMWKLCPKAQVSQLSKFQRFHQAVTGM